MDAPTRTRRRTIHGPAGVAASLGAALACVAAPVAPPAAAATPTIGRYAWPVRGPVIRGFEPPGSPYGPGHRGIDIAVPFGTAVGAASEGLVAFAGFVAGSLYVSIDHPDGVRTTYSFLSAVEVRRGQAVRRGERIAASGHGHPDVDRPHLHFGAKIGDTYIDPMLLLGRGSVLGLVHLAQLEGAPPSRAREPPASFRHPYGEAFGDPRPPGIGYR